MGSFVYKFGFVPMGGASKAFNFSSIHTNCTLLHWATRIALYFYMEISRSSHHQFYDIFIFPCFCFARYFCSFTSFANHFLSAHFLHSQLKQAAANFRATKLLSLSLSADCFSSCNGIKCGGPQSTHSRHANSSRNCRRLLCTHSGPKRNNVTVVAALIKLKRILRRQIATIARSVLRCSLFSYVLLCVGPKKSASPNVFFVWSRTA